MPRNQKTDQSVEGVLPEDLGVSDCLKRTSPALPSPAQQPGQTINHVGPDFQHFINPESSSSNSFKRSLRRGFRQAVVQQTTSKTDFSLSLRPFRTLDHQTAKRRPPGPSISASRNSGNSWAQPPPWPRPLICFNLRYHLPGWTPPFLSRLLRHPMMGRCHRVSTSWSITTTPAQPHIHAITLR